MRVRCVVFNHKKIEMIEINEIINLKMKEHIYRHTSEFCNFAVFFYIDKMTMNGPPSYGELQELYREYKKIDVENRELNIQSIILDLFRKYTDSIYSLCETYHYEPDFENVCRCQCDLNLRVYKRVNQALRYGIFSYFDYWKCWNEDCFDRMDFDLNQLFE